ncbi:MAG: outer membrane protein [Candidatus Tokpelaia sp. JSC189]|nr:MAG: outer membrane protein [Candidatus Tokpelaia sp. JSC189]
MKKILLSVLFISGTVFAYSGSVFAETLMGALAKAYNNSSALSSDRATVRIYDEDIAIAKSGYRPVINGFGTYSRSRRLLSTFSDNMTVGNVGIELDQKVFDGFVTRNSVARAEMQSQAQRESLRNSEQNLLLRAIQAYTDVYTARRIAVFRRQNLAALEEQVRADRVRLEVGEGTRTDLAQSKAQRSQAISQLHQANAEVKSKEAVYLHIVGDVPGPLITPPEARNIPSNMDVGIQIALSEHPAILSSRYAVDAVSYTVKAKEGAFLPQVNIVASTSHEDVFKGLGKDTQVHSIGIQLSVPIYQGGFTSAQVRQSKEQLGQAQIQLDSMRDQVREQLVSAWSQFEGAKAAVVAYRDGVRASQIALDGRIQENHVGQATTLDVLISRTMMIDSQISLVLAERDVIVAGYAVKVALGSLNAANLGLQVIQYDPFKHYNAVKNKWIGIRTP